MAWFKRSSRFTILALALVLGLLLAVPGQVQAQLNPSLIRKLENNFRPPRTPGAPAPINTQSGGTRGPCMTKDSKPLTALVPVGGAGETAAENPTIFWYMPQISAEDAPAPAVEFVLKDEKGQEVYSAQYALAKSSRGIVGAPGVMKLTVSNLYPLETGEYQWQLTLMCDYQDVDRSEDITVEGTIKRVAPDPTLQSRSRQATLEELVALYADKKLWYETVDALSELRRDRPNDPDVKTAWKTLLGGVGLADISEEPLFVGARTIDN